MPKALYADSLSVGTSGTVFEANAGEIRYIVEIASSQMIIVDIGNGTTWIEAFRCGAGQTFLSPPVAIFGSTKKLRLRTDSGTATVLVTYISQT